MELPRIFATAELAALGVGANTIRTLVRGGRLIRLRRGGYAWPADCGPDDVLRSADPIPEPTCRASDDPASDPGWARQPEPLPEEGTRAAPSFDMDAPLPVDRRPWSRCQVKRSGQAVTHRGKRNCST
ncbi:hypothetical protein CGZ98_02015 [Enemella evansiae]|uniref:type IV toxin-antitoxin system AbiEi family antitoxin domain-containing protein n=1 Tax=Enemella evansiae TaxID=2016499 RepID=UPI000B95DFF1|nr:hypothetical protein CGZ98_02015 [Enemella evansiae]